MSIEVIMFRLACDGFFELYLLRRICYLNRNPVGFMSTTLLQDSSTPQQCCY
jgi:hypothetical protein